METYISLQSASEQSWLWKITWLLTLSWSVCTRKNWHYFSPVAGHSWSNFGPRSEQARSAYLQSSCSRQGLHWSNDVITKKNTGLQNLTFSGGNFSEQCRLKRNTGPRKQRAVKQFLVENFEKQLWFRKNIARSVHSRLSCPWKKLFQYNFGSRRTQGREVFFF